jgi:sulfotransferase family protein
MTVAIQRFRHILSKTKVRVPVMWVRHSTLRSGDVFIGSYPRSGSTWLRFILQEILTGEPSRFENVNQRIAFVGRHGNAPALLPGGARLLQTHEAYRKEYGRGIYLVRDPRDVALSEYAFQKARGWVDGDFQTYLMGFLKGEVNGFGSWRDHVRSWVAAADASADKVRIYRYDELRKSTLSWLTSLLEFLNVSADNQKISDAIASNSLQEMRKKEQLSPQKVSKKDRFVRNGSVGGWRENLTDEQIDLVNRYLGAELKRLGYSESR